MATLTTRPRRIDLDDQGEFMPEEQSVASLPGGGQLLQTHLRPGQTIRPAYMVLHDADGTPIYRADLVAPQELTLLPGESLTIETTIYCH
jgi:hypothetical protein